MDTVLNIELRGPCVDGEEPTVQDGDTVATVTAEGRVRFHKISGIGLGPDGTVLYGMGGEMVAIEQCYLLYTPVPTVDQQSS